jgi:ribonucleotide monophosphatase NagD (HAD superfamily)
MREMVEKYETVLVVGGEGEKCREVAEGYGFKDVITPGDIIKDNAATTPFRKLTQLEHSSSRERDLGKTKIEGECCSVIRIYSRETACGCNTDSDM